MNRRFGPVPDPGIRFAPRPGAYAIIDTGDGVLATFQETPRAELQLPGGGIDPGEATLPALIREIREETGYSITAPRRLGMFHRYTFMPEYGFHAHKLCHIYVARLGRRQSDPIDPGHSAVFLPWDVALTELAVAGDRHFVAMWLRRRGRGHQAGGPL
ncbi:NTP pyrophosphohydrolase [Roseibacterium elongatum DSM 19469]|uniref:NTP pyrophosphohydrolase n=1 Tax=Roseicyclus elongatus DSM 19469 TaxID=1294273 RepID=W8RQW4_9RHOB|nr:NUDIX hydrolase [Roseibacterium elongatum]AHM03554.1 NTP pyrophosphohydrolase [Roseibacterium elongatum DSM 19469]